jgi:hypothetical protein
MTISLLRRWGLHRARVLVAGPCHRFKWAPRGAVQPGLPPPHCFHRRRPPTWRSAVRRGRVVAHHCLCTATTGLRAGAVVPAVAEAAIAPPAGNRNLWRTTVRGSTRSEDRFSTYCCIGRGPRLLFCRSAFRGVRGRAVDDEAIDSPVARGPPTTVPMIYQVPRLPPSRALNDGMGRPAAFWREHRRSRHASAGVPVIVPPRPLPSRRRRTIFALGAR